MRRFRAVFQPLDPIGFNTLSFEAVDMADALASLAVLNCRQPFQLWCDGAYCGRLARVSEANASYWRFLGDLHTRKADAGDPAKQARQHI